MDFVSNVGLRSQVQVNEAGSWVELGNNSLNGYESNVLYRNLGRAKTVNASMFDFADVGYIAGADCIEDGRAAVYTDIEGDGDLDLFVQSFGRPTRLLVNEGEKTGNWLHVKLHGTESNKDGIGARIVATIGERRIVREISTTSGYLAGQSLWAFFGLGDAKRVDQLEVFWPSGQRTVLADVDANRRLDVREGDVSATAKR